MLSSPEDFVRVVEEWQQPIYNLAFRMLGNEADARDATQEIFVIVLRDLSSYDRSRPLQPWIYRVARNAILNQLKARHTRRAKELRAAMEKKNEPRRQETDPDVNSFVKAEIAALPAELSAPLVLHYLNGLSKTQVAEALEVPRTTVQSRIRKALESLRARLKHAGLLAVVPSVELVLEETETLNVPADLSVVLEEQAALASAGSMNATAIGGALVKKKIALTVVLTGVVAGVTGFGLGKLELTSSESEGSAAGTELVSSLDAADSRRETVDANLGSDSQRQKARIRSLEDELDRRNEELIALRRRGRERLRSVAGSGFRIDASNSKESGDRRTEDTGTGITYEGQVVLRNGPPLEDVLVMVYPNPTPGAISSAEWGQKTDAHGRFRFDNAPTGAVILDVSTEEAVNQRQEYDSAADLPTPIVLAQGGRVELDVSVTGDRELPSDVQFRLLGGPDRFRGGSVPIENGRAAVKGIEPGEYAVQLLFRDFPPHEKVKFEIKGEETVHGTAVLDGVSPPAIVRVVDPQGDPVAGAKVRVAELLIERPGHQTRYGFDQGKTDFDGVFRTIALRGRDMEVAVEAPGYQPTEIRNAATKLVNDELLVTVRRGGAIFLTVVDDAGRPLNDISVQCRSLTPAQIPGGGSRKGGTTQGGEVSIGDLVASRYQITLLRTLRVEKVGSSTQFHNETLGVFEVEVADSERKEVTYTVKPSFPIRGAVRVNGAPALGGTVRIWHISEGSRVQAEVDANGQFTADVRGPGDYRFTYYEHEPNQRGSKRRVATRFLEPNTAVELIFDTGSVHGRVLRPDGSPLANVKGQLSGPARYDFTTDDQGTFRLASVDEGVYRWSFSEVPADLFPTHQTLRVAGATEDTFRFVRGTEIEIHVEVPGEGPAPRFGYYHLSEAGRSWLRKGSGPNRLLWPKGGTVGYVGAYDFAPGVFTVTDPAEPIRVALQPGGRLAIRIHDFSGRLLFDHPVEITPRSAPALHPFLLRRKTSARGSARFDLAFGRYGVSTTLPNGATLSADVNVVPGEVTVDLRP